MEDAMEQTTMEQNYPQYRWIIAALFIFVTIVKLYFLSVTAPMMTALMEDFNTSLTIIGYSSTIVSTLMGVFMFVGVVFVEKWGVKKCYIISCAALLLGNVICMLSTSVGMFIFGRAFIGIGFGISGTLGAATVYMWFPAKERPALFTANVMGAALAQILGFNITVPMYDAFGWQFIFGVCAALSAIGVILWMFLGKEFNMNSKDDKVANANDLTEKPGAFDGLKLAFRSKELWILAVFMTGVTLANYGVNFFYPTFLSQIRGLSATAASSVTSVFFLANTIGTLVGGVVAVALGRRKPIIMIAGIGLLVGYLSLFSLTSVPMLVVAMGFTGFMSLMNPAAQSAALEVPDMTPAKAAGANSMMYGFGSILTLFMSSILGGLSGAIGLTGAMVTFTVTLIAIAIIAALFFKDRGPKAKGQTT
jgi:MFS family permease